jgi:hypothetical protein
MTFHALFVPSGVYLRTPTGEVIGRLNKPGESFETLEEARKKSDWLEMAVQFQQARRLRDSVGVSRSLAAEGRNAGNARPASKWAKPFEVQIVEDRSVSYE